MVLDIYLIYLFKSISDKNELELKHSLYQQQAQINMGCYTGVDIQNQAYRKIIHEMVEHIRIIQNNPTNCEEYCQAILENANKAGLKLFQCKNYILKTIVNHTLFLCKQRNIHFTIDSDDSDIDFIKPLDITTIFANLLKNAVEANEVLQEKDKYIIMKMKQIRLNLVIYVENSCDSGVDFKYIEGKSEKKIIWA